MEYKLKKFAPVTNPPKPPPYVMKTFAPSVAGPPTPLPVDTRDYVSPALIVPPPAVCLPKPKIPKPSKIPAPPPPPPPPAPLVLSPPPPPAPEPGSKAWKIAQFVSTHFPKK